MLTTSEANLPILNQNSLNFPTELELFHIKNFTPKERSVTHPYCGNLEDKSWKEVAPMLEKGRLNWITWHHLPVYTYRGAGLETENHQYLFTKAVMFKNIGYHTGLFFTDKGQAIVTSPPAYARTPDGTYIFQMTNWGDKYLNNWDNFITFTVRPAHFSNANESVNEKLYEFYQNHMI